MTLDSVLARLDIPDARDALADGWEVSQAERPEGTPFFLAPEFVREACALAYLPDQFADEAVEAARAIAADEAASALAWHAWWWIYGTDEPDRQRVRGWPRVGHSLGPTGGLLYLLALLAGGESMHRIHREHDIPEEIAAHTLSQIQLYLDQTRERQGYPEVTPHLIGWLLNHFTGNIYRLARLQFQFGDSRYDIRVFRDDETGRVVALSEDGVRYRPDGQRLRADDDEAGAWTAGLAREDGEVVGFPIHPGGRALHEQVRLAEDAWREMLAPGDPVLHIHIPGGEPMYYDQCGEAFERALEFFPRHYPDYTFNAFVCGSWILNTALQELLGEDSNLVRFQREVYLFPIGLSDESLPGAIFDEPPEDLSQAPRETSLQHAYIDAMQGGGLVAGGGALVLLPEDVDWGAQVYLRQCREAPGR